MGCGKVAGLCGGWRKEARARYASAEGFVGGPQFAQVGSAVDDGPEGVSR
jgi:hypothetical protein